MEFIIIVAVDEDNGIGKNGQLPWKSLTDMRFFRRITIGMCDTIEEFTSGKSNNTADKGSKKNAIIMGRNTADSLTMALPNRLNIVITSSEYNRDNFHAYSSLDTALLELKKFDLHRVFVIGGTRLLEEGIQNKWCRRVFITRINGKYESNVIVGEHFFETLHKFSIQDMFEVNNDSVQTITEYSYQNDGEKKYLDLGRDIMNNGNYRQNRNAKTYSLFGEKLEYEITEHADGTFEIPILTTKHMFTRGINEELLFFMNGKTNTLELEEKGIRIWSGNTSKEFLDAHGLTNLNPGEMGPMYGFIWRHFGAIYRGSDHDYTGEGIDQLQECINNIVNDPYSRRNVMTTYNPSQVNQGVLYPCHGLITQFYVEGDNRISVQTYQRSADYFLGLPFNIMSYSVFLCLIVKLVNAELMHCGKSIRYSTGRVITVLGDVHIYSDVDPTTETGVDHIQAVKKQLERYDKTFRFPNIRICKDIQKLGDIMTMQNSDFEIVNYASHPAIRAEMIA